MFCLSSTKLNRIHTSAKKKQREFDASKGIHHPKAWGPVGQKNETLDEEAIRNIAETDGKTAAQVRPTVEPEIQLAVLPIPKSSHAGRQFENIDIFDFELSEDEMKTISALTRDDGRNNDLDPAKHQEF